MRSKAFFSVEERARYLEMFDDWLLKGYMRRVGKQEAKSTVYYYLAHFPVFKGTQPNRKIRPVMDAAAKHRGSCINYFLLTGPNLMQDLPTALMRFRARSVALSGDVSEMFLQVRMNPEDCAYHRVLLWNELGDEIVLEFLRHVFGSTCSPVIAMFAARFLARPFEELYPRAIEVITNSTIMDDGMDSFSTKEEARAVRDQLKEIYGTGGMEIKK